PSSASENAWEAFFERTLEPPTMSKQDQCQMGKSRCKRRAVADFSGNSAEIGSEGMHFLQERSKALCGAVCGCDQIVDNSAHRRGSHRLIRRKNRPGNAD